MNGKHIKSNQNQSILSWKAIALFLSVTYSYAFAEEIIEISNTNNLIEYISNPKNKIPSFQGTISKINPLQPYPIKYCQYENSKIEVECTAYNFTLDENNFPNINTWILYSAFNDLHGKISAIGIPNVQPRGITKGSGMVLFKPKAINQLRK